MDSEMSPPIDRAHLTEMTGGDTEFEAELMQEFLNSAPGLIQSLETALENNDMKALEMAAHTLKGSCRSLGAMVMSNPCEELEEMGRQGSASGFEPFLKEVQDHYAVAHAYILQAWNLKAA